MGALSFLAAVGKPILDYALPIRCPGCGAITAEEGRFCLSCWSELHFLGAPCCSCCGLPFEVEPGMEEARCGPCLQTPPPWRSARAALAYGEMARTIAIRLKYGRRIGLARLMARYMAPHVRGMAEAGEAPLLVPVPLHRWRLWNRGFNQSALIGGHLSRMTGIPADPLVLRRTRATRPLRAMSPHAREKEVRGAFLLDPKRAGDLRGRTVILIDDVHTSGATARACAQALLSGGVEAVHLLCWARVLPDAAD